METTSRRTDPPLSQALFQKPWAFDFFQAVRLLTLLDDRTKPVGGANPPSQEAVRFVVHRTLDFCASQIHSLKRPAAGRKGDPLEGSPDEDEDASEDAAGRDQDKSKPPRMSVNFMGLVGPKGVLPWHYHDAASGKANPLSRFLDLFQHRLISLFYRAWEKYRLPVGYELAHRPKAAEAGRRAASVHDRFTTCLLDTIGLGPAALRDRQSVPDLARLAYAGLLGQHPANAASLRGLLADYFQVPVEITQFKGQWFRIQAPSLSWLSGSGIHNQLGYGALAGNAVYNPQATFELALGPLSFSRFCAFLPGERACQALVDWTVFCAPSHLEFHVRLVLAAPDVPYCWLNGRTRLGLASWLKTEEFRHDPSDVVFRGQTPFDGQSHWRTS